MPKLSHEMRAERRETIVAAATARFASQGFHATSMAEIIGSSGLAAGTVYKHFSSKEDLIVAAARRALDDVGAAVRIAVEREPTPSLEDFLCSVRAALPSTAEGKLRAHLVLHSWAETSRNAELARLVRERHAAMLTASQPLVREWKRRGELASDRDDAEAARELLARIQGDIVQAAIFAPAERQ